MQNNERIEKFRQVISNKYLIYNSLFLNLPNENTTYTGVFIPLLHKLSKEGYRKDAEPKAVIEDFLANHTELTSDKEKFDLLFRMIKYIERQVVLFDSIEDAAFSSFKKQKIEGLLHPGNENYTNLVEHLKKFSSRVVFTAHPTQFYPNNVQGIMHELRNAVQDDSITKIDNILQQLAFTPFINREKPTPFEEAQSIIFYLRYVYYETLGKIYHQIGKATNLPPNFNPNLLEMGFWPGGDRDGNPFVTKETTYEVATQLRITIMKCYYNHLKVLMRKLTFREVNEHLDKLKRKLYKQIFKKKTSLKSEEILEIMYRVRKLVVENYKSLNVDLIDDFIGRVHLFGNHFATLDIRQDSSVHTMLISEIFEKEFKIDYNELSSNEKLEYLTQKSLNIDSADYEDDLVVDTIDNIYQIQEIQHLNGQRGLHRYIISNSENIFDVLHVYALFKYCGYQEEDINIDIVPLFETMDGMDNSEAVMKSLYENEVYKKHLNKRNKEQHIMLGFSDGTKDGGYLKANWEIYRTKERLTALSRQEGYQVVFFDGRGGPPARGGGKTHQFYAAQGNEIANEKIQLTIQGQTITSVFGTHEQATYNFEQLLLAGVKSKQRNSWKQGHKELLTELADKSYEKYISLKEHELFIPYLEEMTTLKYYGATNIGSRPTKRNSDAKLQLKDLRAIPFVGSWGLVRQNVPGYYGLGTALNAYEDQFHLIEDLYEHSAFFRSLILNSIMSMKKSYFPLTSYMKNDKKYGEFWKNLREEYELAKRLVLKLTKQNELMENEELAKRSINMREKIILPLLSIQQYALQKIQENDSNKEIYEKMVIRALFGNINASRNSA
ncbi:phosphoenolpyruvate carboxylase [Psychroflexus montanilacus]|uniref:phosphoenolpyruvate carboxylase n=1 Tax=Psychroflexus montanilacus TaxID=2873598 RepID=UPI001CD00CC4|nr:phosphoenolpyruvate carboxylase [Psychroflexus montanilacus]MBZ9652396.1 phosphoenolpyruvate carboxylase [Psychroflexus montanilacus]